MSLPVYLVWSILCCTKCS